MLPKYLSHAVGLAALIALTACGPPANKAAGVPAKTISLRHLAETKISAPARSSYPIKGQLAPTPSDRQSRYFVLFQKSAWLTGTIVAILRQEHGPRIAYARVELDCAQRLFHVVGVGNRRSFAETGFAQDGPLRSMEGMPLRAELAAFICHANGTPLAADPAPTR